jgi:putative effector of murein hydrolase LrgA (UPF0299 family)
LDGVQFAPAVHTSIISTAVVMTNAGLLVVFIYNKQQKTTGDHQGSKGNKGDETNMNNG